jgi:phosphoribosylformylglycinamidine synthase
LAVALAECTFDTAGVGLSVDLTAASSAPAAWKTASTLFSESASRVVVSVGPEHLAALRDRARSLGVPAQEIGRTGTDRIRIAIDGVEAVDIAVADAEELWSSALEKHFKQKAA